MTQQQIRFLVLSDTHDHAFPVAASLPAVDVVIHCGDLTMIGGLSNYRRALDSLAACPAEIKLVIPGNHDVSLDPEWWDENLDSDDDKDEPVRARALFTLDEYTRCGVRFLDEGTHEIALHDGRSFKVYASQYTPAFSGYAFGYSPEEDRFNGTGRRIPDDEVERGQLTDSTLVGDMKTANSNILDVHDCGKQSRGLSPRCTALDIYMKDTAYRWQRFI
ncbi:Ser/Thr protein phosphatase family protein [Metarhizium album ARSEF 1941]|uniref:Ser/Thr protein phosphatase family protein n=1 Tax=Metarhizium album (strain ARSEF 1941) TaxID=1081103 RepID=A0A0B2WM07_METAS|nr:Ser/Thr protein phosphatase family protein [Metarhizium album ARSEF 1941]KHN94050.1 Ser/Thr protein phosphatase family protein [Metarhizium album ARSEF 1941]